MNRPYLARTSFWEAFHSTDREDVIIWFAVLLVSGDKGAPSLPRGHLNDGWKNWKIWKVSIVLLISSPIPYQSLQDIIHRSMLMQDFAALYRYSRVTFKHVGPQVTLYRTCYSWLLWFCKRKTFVFHCKPSNLTHSQTVLSRHRSEVTKGCNYLHSQLFVSCEMRILRFMSQRSGSKYYWLILGRSHNPGSVIMIIIRANLQNCIDEHFQYWVAVHAFLAVRC